MICMVTNEIRDAKVKSHISDFFLYQLICKDTFKKFLNYFFELRFSI